MVYTNAEEAYHKEFSDTVIRSIRNLYVQGMPQRRLAREFNVSLKCIYNIVHCNTYTHVATPEGYEESLKTIKTRKRK